jgi:Curli production assembly/transport component CsgG
MRTSTIIILSVLLIPFVVSGGCSAGKSTARQGYDFSTVDTIAVIDVVGRVSGESVKNQVSDFFVMEMLQKGFAPVARTEVQALLKEQDFQMSGTTSNEGVAKAGQILNVPVVMIINVPKFGDEIALTAKIVNVEDGSILWMGSGTGKTGGLLTTLGGAAAGVIAGAAVSDDSDAALIAGGVAGGVAGHMLTPQAAEITQQIVQKMCLSLPSKIPQQKGWLW